MIVKYKRRKIKDTRTQIYYAVRIIENILVYPRGESVQETYVKNLLYLEPCSHFLYHMISYYDMTYIYIYICIYMNNHSTT